MDIKLLAVDMDGTLLQSDHATILPEDLQAIQAATEAGVLFVPATGRMRYRIPKAVAELVDWRYCISCNGASIYDRQEQKALYADCLSLSMMQQLIQVLQSFGVFFEIYANGLSYANRSYLEQYQQYNVPHDMIEMYREKINPVDDIREAIQTLANLEKIYIPHIKEEIHADLKNALLCFDVEITSSVDTNLEVNSKTANKGNALKKLAELLQIPIESCMAVGDNLNDLAMIQTAGLGVAMGNAEQQVKHHADYITAPHDQAGVAQAVRKFILSR